MKKAIFILASALVNAGCATSNQGLSGNRITNEAEWDECVVQVCNDAFRKIPEASKECKVASSYLRATVRNEILSKCGTQPVPSELTPEMRNWLEKECKQARYNEEYSALVGPFASFPPNSEIVSRAKSACNAIYEEAQKIQIRIGSPERLVYEKFGPPLRSSQSVGRWGVRKQLVYSPNIYIDIENGHVTSWQTQ